MSQMQTRKRRHNSKHGIQNWRKKRGRQQNVIASSVRMRNRRNSTAAIFLEVPMKMGASSSIISLLKSRQDYTMQMATCPSMDAMSTKRQCCLMLGWRVSLERLTKQLRHSGYHWPKVVVAEVVEEAVVTEEVVVVKGVDVVEVVEVLVGDEEVVVVEVVVNKVRRR
jgi:hypothetical protein